MQSMPSCREFGRANALILGFCAGNLLVLAPQIYIALQMPLQAWDALDYWGPYTLFFLGEESDFSFPTKHPPAMPLLLSGLVDCLGGRWWTLLSPCLLWLAAVKYSSGSLTFAFLALVLTVTTPLIENHILAAGYAEIYLGTFMALAHSLYNHRRVLTFSNFACFALLAIALMTKVTAFAYFLMASVAFVLCNARVSKTFLVGAAILLGALLMTIDVNISTPITSLQWTAERWQLRIDDGHVYQFELQDFSRWAQCWFEILIANQTFGLTVLIGVIVAWLSVSGQVPLGRKGGEALLFLGLTICAVMLLTMFSERALFDAMRGTGASRALLPALLPFYLCTVPSMIKAIIEVKNGDELK